MGISFLVSVYKNEKVEYLKAAMDSMFAQTRPADEIVLIEDGPLPQELLDCIKEYQDKHPELVTYQFEKNVKLGLALAKGAEIASNEYLARMDTDDISRPDRLEKQEAFMDAHPELLACGGYIEEFYDDGSHQRVKKIPLTNEEIYHYGRFRSPMNHVTVMFRRSKLLEAGNYQNCPSIEDYDLWIRAMAQGYQFANIPEVLVDVRTNDGFYDRRGGDGYAKRYFKLRKRQHKLGVTNFPEYLYACFGTFVMVCGSKRVKKLMYKFVLRKD